MHNNIHKTHHLFTFIKTEELVILSFRKFNKKKYYKQTCSLESSLKCFNKNLVFCKFFKNKSSKSKKYFMTSKEFLVFLYGIEVLNKLDTKLIQVKMMTHQTNKSVNKNNKYHDDVDVNRGEIYR